jgi:imidazolonepropionase-like amidohydrolase
MEPSTLNRQDHIGSIAEGKNANLLSVSDIENEEIFKDGIGYDSAKIFDSVRSAYVRY